MAIIMRKISRPELPVTHSPRPRLRSLVRARLAAHQVLVVSAMAGSGKTTAVAEALLDLGRPVAWLSLDRSDRSPGRLLTYLEAALVTVLPDAAGVATSALEAQIPYAETAGLLAESVPNGELVVVFDNVERLEKTEQVWSVIDAFVRYAAPTTTVVLIGRHPLPPGVLDLPVGAVVGQVTADELALTVDEARAFFKRVDRTDVDPDRRVRAVNGWMAGVLFGSGELEGGATGADPLHELLSGQILARLPEPDRAFLVRTAILPEVSAARAEQLGLRDPESRILSLREVHLPGTWDQRRETLRPHPRFRDHLLEEFAALPRDEQRQLRRRHADALVEGHDDESAVDEYLRAGARPEAVAAARRCIVSLIDRADFDLAERWIAEFAPDESPSRPTELSIARLAVAIASYRMGDAAAVADDIAQRGALTAFVSDSDRAAQLVAWTYMWTGRYGEFRAVAALARQTPGMLAIRYGASLGTPAPPAPRPSRTNGPADGMIFLADFFLGRLATFTAPPVSRFAELLMGPFRIAAARVQGRTQGALDAYRSYRSQRGQLALRTMIGPEVLMDAGLIDEARETALTGQGQADAVGDPFWGMLSLISQAKIAARHDRDPARARHLIAQIGLLPGTGEFSYLRELADLWLGLAMLHDRDDAAALSRLRAVARSMDAHEHLLELSTAAVYLSEAEWRAGHDEAADAAADLAMRAATRIGTDHLLLQALTDFPAVITRRLDSEASSESDWHFLSRPLALQRRYVTLPTLQPQVQFCDIGVPKLVVEGETARPRLAKVFEILAFLLTQPGRQADRARLLSVLFDDEDNAQTRTYLRQILRLLRIVLPEDTVRTDADFVALRADLVVATESARFERLVVEATRLKGESRIDALSEALAIAGADRYLRGLESNWIQSQRTHLDALRQDAEFALARQLYEANRPLEAGEVVEKVLSADPLREDGWRLRMRIAREFHDTDEVVGTFNRCAEALRTIGLQPSAGTRRLFESLVSV